MGEAGEDEGVRRNAVEPAVDQLFLLPGHPVLGRGGAACGRAAGHRGSW